MSDSANTELPMDQQKQYAMLTHLSGIVLPLVGAIVAYVVWKDKGEFISANTKSALNFNIVMTIVSVVAGILTIVSLGLLFFLPFLVWVGYIIFCIMAGLKANEGEIYSYPITYAFIK